MTFNATTTAALGAQIILTSDLPLPPKPAPPVEGQTVAWVDLLDVEAGGFWYKGRFFPVDEKEMDRLALVHEEMTAEGYQPPQLIEHDRKGENRGALLALQKWPDPRRGGKPTLIGALSFTDPDALTKIARKEIRYFSPGMGNVEDSRTGKVWTNCINEVSRVAAPHRKTGEHILGAEQDTHQTKEGETMEDDKKPTTPPQDAPPVPDDKTRLDMMEARVAACETTLGEIKATMGEVKTMMEGIKGVPADDASPTNSPAPGAENPPPSPQLAEVVALRAEVEAMKAEAQKARDEADRARFDAGFKAKAGKAITLSESHADILFTLSKQNPEGFKALIGAAEDKDKTPPAPPKAPEGPAYDPWGQMSLGEGAGAEAPPEKVKPSDVPRLAKDAGVSVEEMHTRLVRENRF